MGVRVADCTQPMFPVLGCLLLRDTSLQMGPLLLTHVVLCGTTMKESERSKKRPGRNWGGRGVGGMGP